MATTRRQACELVMRMLAPGWGSDDFLITVNLVNLHLNGAIAAAAVADLRANIDIEGVESVGDAFYATTKGITISQDADTGYYTATIPQPPAAISRGLDITSLKFIAESGFKYSSYRVSPREWDYMNVLPIESSKIYWKVNGNKVYMQSVRDLTNDKAMIEMVSTQSSTGTGLDDPITLPDNYMPDVIKYMAGVFNIMLNIPIDNSNDGTQSTQVK